MFTQRQRLSRMASLRKSRLASLRKSSLMPSGDEDKVLKIFAQVNGLENSIEKFSDAFTIKPKPEFLKKMANVKSYAMKVMGTIEDKNGEEFKAAKILLEVLENEWPYYINDLTSSLDEGRELRFEMHEPLVFSYDPDVYDYLDDLARKFNLKL
jgi:hypothetical protein